MQSNVADIALVMKELKLGGDAERAIAPVNSLIERAQSGDAAAFDQLMITYQHRVVAVAFRLLGNRDDARDAAQETFLRVYKHLAKFDLKQDFSAWLYRIAINVCRDVARKRVTHFRTASIEDEIQSGNLNELLSTDNTEAAAIQAQQQKIILRALDTLSEKERRALVLRDLEGLSTEEVARILGSSQTTVRSQISTARAKIKAFRDRLLSKGGKK
ncbi:MAG TPA: sigma-70 family RNA polymerase sigma factor [Blastocatellia bacterium]|nr:sigma-70 family RNA polymerase sigma factor [Blastocatellia bacterium]